MRSQSSIKACRMVVTSYYYNSKTCTTIFFWWCWHILLAGPSICFWWKCLTWCFISSNFELHLLHGTPFANLFLHTVLLLQLFCMLSVYFLRLWRLNYSFAWITASWDFALGSCALHPAKTATQTNISAISPNPLASLLLLYFSLKLFLLQKISTSRVG